jgi:hypothetical protein
MPICLWKGCEFATEEFAAFQEHVNTKHVQQPHLQKQPLPQQLNLHKQNGDTETIMVEEGPMAKKAKLNLLNEDNIIKRGANRQNSIQKA